MNGLKSMLVVKHHRKTLSSDDEGDAWKKDISVSLDQKLTLNFPELTIEEVVDFLRRNTNVNFVLDPQVSGDDIAPITMSLQDVKL